MCFMGEKQIFIIMQHDFKPVTNQNYHMRIPMPRPIYSWMEDIPKSQLVHFSMVYWSWVLARSISNGLIFP